MSLAQPYELVGEWEVGLMEIQYARTWYNVPSDQFVQVANTTILIPEGIYADIGELIKILNKKIKWGLGGNPPVTVEFNTIETTQKMRLKIETNDSSEELAPDLYLSKRLSDMLGFVMTGPFSAGDRKFHCTGKILGTESSKSRCVELAQDYLGDNKRNSNQRKRHFIKQSKEEDLPGKNEKIYTLKHASDSPTVMRVR